MARPRDFDPDAALDAAVRLFWERGFFATSVRDLCDAMGIQPGSFYAAFGNKEACFRRALERYLATQPQPGAPGPDAIRAWLRVIVDPKREPKGCLLVHSAVEHPSLDALTQSLVTERLEALERFFTLCLRGRPSARADASLLAATVLAIHVRARAGADSRE
ncbi:MAG: TetR/AcrR family transcriptional regulator, partial [Myxococcota bacterium]|nr:TetR/AcrR family transcriptional regulator [Myxococcota bacterium]